MCNSSPQSPDDLSELIFQTSQHKLGTKRIGSLRTSFLQRQRRSIFTVNEKAAQTPSSPNMENRRDSDSTKTRESSDKPKVPFTSSYNSSSSKEIRNSIFGYLIENGHDFSVAASPSFKKVIKLRSGKVDYETDYTKEIKNLPNKFFATSEDVPKHSPIIPSAPPQSLSCKRDVSFYIYILLFRTRPSCPKYGEPVVPDKSSVLKRKGNREPPWKSGAHPSRRKIVNGKDQLHTNFTPCGCQYLCGKQCPCQENGTSCVKSCGCSKSCENRFKGCSCTKSKCRGRRCPCAAAGRECDPDVCKNCWISCGDGSLGEPSRPRRPSGQCSNQNILQGKRKRILLGKSDWGAFLKNPARKDDFLGEYTGELISHEEAERRGKVYDFLFNLNDEYVIDAYRMGNLFRFVNHSSIPNLLTSPSPPNLGICSNRYSITGSGLRRDRIE